MVHCGAQSTQTAGGTGSEILATVVRADSSGVHPVANGRVYCFPRTYLPDTTGLEPTWAARTGYDGTFRIAGLDADSYIIEVVDTSGLSIAASASVAAGETRNLGTLMVLPTASVQVHLLPESLMMAGVQYFVRIYGTRISSRNPIDSLGVLLTRLPTGTPLSFNVLVIRPAPWSFDFKDISALPGATIDLPSIALPIPN
jgi:hypothetical protein